MLQRFFNRYNAFLAFETPKRCFKVMKDRNWDDPEIPSKITKWCELMTTRTFEDLKASYAFDMAMFVNPATKDAHVRSMFNLVTAELCRRVGGEGNTLSPAPLQKMVMCTDLGQVLSTGWEGS